MKNLLSTGLNIICIQSGGKVKIWERPVVFAPRVKAEVGILKGPDTAHEKNSTSIYAFEQNLRKLEIEENFFKPPLIFSRTLLWWVPLLLPFIR